ncbi:MAG: thioredoxin [Candidatus Aureabacteria bacterium]|nr:thioredoxin [Candidatus Auribacterota bacterium]
MALELNDSNFTAEVLRSDIPVLVDFWAPWCMPCRMVAPAVEEISKKYADSLKVCKLNVDDAPMIATQFGVMSIPMLGIFKEGQLVDEIIGAVPQNVIEDKIKLYIN